MTYWQDPGLHTSDGATHQIVATVAVDPGNLNECRIAIDEFVDLQIGIALPRHRTGAAGVDGRRGRADRPQRARLMGRARHPVPRVRRRHVQVRDLGRRSCC